MKKIVLLLLFTAAAISWIILIPIGVESSFAKVHAVKASSSTVVNTISCSGTLEAAKKYQIVLGYNVKIQKSVCQIGDSVIKGQRLLSLDKSITLQLLNNTVTGTANQTSSLPVLTENQKALLKQAMSSGIVTKNNYQIFINQLTDQNNARTALSSGSTKTTNTIKLVNGLDNKLKAPASGVISAIDDGTNGISGAGSILAEIIDFHTIQVKVQVDESNLKCLKVGQKVIITGNGFYGSYQGVVRTIYPIAKLVSASSGTQNMVDVLVRLNKPDKKLLPGLSVNATIQISKEEGMVRLPYDAVRQDDDGTEYAFVVKSGKAIRQNITTGDESSNFIEVTKGLRNGQLVIDDDNNSITNGMNVRIQ